MSESAELTAYTEAFSDQFKHMAALDMAKALDEARATVAALTAERDAAYRLGWCDARDAAADVADEMHPVTAVEISNLQPPAPTEHDAAEDHRSYSVEAWNERL